MKKLGTYTMRGQLPVNTNNHRLQLFDGSFKTGYRVTRFEIFAQSPSSNHEFNMYLHTEASGALNVFNADDQTQIAWALYNAPNVYSGPKAEWIDSENMVIEDLYVSLYGTTDSTFCNYLIELDQYSFDAWVGAYAMVRNKSQA